ncbi:PIN domain-containing protein [Nocardia donostiensis]|uniref:PIN domain-containing protein n=1 Tax=Nocardia donostiensis TaxID=1538463 RepID=A0A1W0AVK6_9NOCA|nr:PIN domain-containing protein [Nocardia donostiensis]ONM46458.1 PIN domain-containing protein [Nocardia donostiensis]OQS14246.1 PIN domain-containing protein [Nocardia donostiensis]OQS18140.1 PIN domain-containing protein [Nocardia donostiensis]
MFAVVLDTCVLWPSLQRDFLLSLAVEGLYRPLWSSTILEELEFHEARKLVARGEDRRNAETRAHRLIEQMGSAFDGALVEGWEPHEGTFGLPDADDEHVIAAAVVGGAGAIVTDNVRHFPQSKVPKHIQILRPAQFAADTVAVAPGTALQAVEAITGRRRNPPESVEHVLETLVSRYGMVEAVELLRSGA